MNRLSILFLSTALTVGVTTLSPQAVRAEGAVDPAQVVATYADIGAATYGDALIAARSLQSAVDALIANPSDQALADARAAWIAARVPYQQSEVFRFGNPVVDDWEGRVNSWPLDEGLIDYVDAGYGESEENPLSVINVIASPKISIGSTEVEAQLRFILFGRRSGA